MNGSSPAPQALARGSGQRLLIAVGDQDAAELLATTLELAGYRIGAAGSGAQVARRLVEHRFDLVVIDAELPGLDDLGQGGRLKPAYRPPVLLLAACGSLARLVPELSAGERDYVTKPVRLPEVLARVKVLLRDTDAAARPGGALHHADVVLDDDTCRARRGGRTLDLTPAEHRLLRHLLVNARMVLSKEQISRYVWGECRGDNAIEQLVSRLRRKVDRHAPALIHTRRGFGYWLGEL
ncbi:DNA-binding response OmpR family regulator [Streptomyces sp. Ag109_O5-1]|uniref:response regulator transcription factor n=1 Tax=Streptomyces sp. Ag109_O5-1 TaxID=1938851 RepID=UPI000F4DCB38|nr:response regulator transcription factor [Streptomyces sp. Ag109_O5-1]RPE37510.1 DNA-binding response OmpR family regulator [Streptomyces sp. Ag109_O5-1]